MKIIITEKQLQSNILKIYEDNNILDAKQRWEELSGEDKLFVVEMLKAIYPNKANLITEDKWYNTLGDVLGVFDPTGAVDTINGISYWRQGDKLYALLSWISVFPYIGDAIAKPVVGFLKAGGKGPKLFKEALLLGDTAKAGRIAKKSPILTKFLKTVSEWGPKVIESLKKLIGKVPFVGTGFLRLVDEYIALFTKAGKEMNTTSKLSKKITKNVASKLTKNEKEYLLKELEKDSKNFRGFRDLALKNPTFADKWIAGGIGRLWGNRATRSLMRRTKWYLGLLDYLGVANFIGPEELENEVDNLDQKVKEYSETPESNELWQEELTTEN
jgi:hypothetical protein